MSRYVRRNSAVPFSVSQNYLTSSKTIRRLLHLTSISKSDHVIEIGAGKGHITRELVNVCQSVSAFEIDNRLSEQLHVTLSYIDNLKLSNSDFLKATLPKNGQYKVFSNIPFSITTDIMRKLTSANNPPQEAWLVMEKGAARRFMGNPQDSLISLCIKPFFDIEIIYYFSRQDFHPAPSVDAVLLHLTKKEQPDIPAAQRKSYSDFVEKGIKYGIYRNLTKRQVSTALRLARLPHIKETGAILYIQWLCLFRCYHQLHGGQPQATYVYGE